MEEGYAEYKSKTDTSTGGKHRQVDCEICGASLAAGSYQGHLELQHNIFHSMAIQQDILVKYQPVVYRAIKLIATGTYVCPVPHCVDKRSTKWSLLWHFLDPHPQDLIVIPIEGTALLPKCKRCGMQTEVGTLYGRHQCTRLCQEGWDRKEQWEAAEAARMALTRTFRAYRKDLERVEMFKYLGQLLAYNDNNSQVVRSNLKKAHKSWAQVSRVLRAENASPKACDVFYKANVQAVLLFGSEMWRLSPLNLKSL